MRVRLTKPDQVFVVRVWKEPHGNGTAICEWRGRVNHVNTRSEHHFVGLGAFTDVFEELLNSVPGESPTKHPAKSESRT